MKKIFLLIVLGLFISNIVFSQEKSVKKTGWKLPDILGFNSKSETEKVIDGIAVKISEINLEDRKPAIFIKSTKNSRTKSEVFWEVRKATSFSLNNKIFAYVFLYVPFRIDKVKQGNKILISKSYTGAMLQYYYSDEEGDSKFETRKSFISLEVKLPNWVKP